MNNRDPNKQNTYTNLAAWCEKYHKDSGIKIHPSSVPIELVLEDVLGYAALIMSRITGISTALDQANIRIDQLVHAHDDLVSRVEEIGGLREPPSPIFVSSEDHHKHWEQQNNPSKNLNPKAKVKK